MFSSKLTILYVGSATHTHTHTRTHNAHSDTHTHTHAQTYTQRTHNTHAHTRTHTRTHTQRTHTHAHTLIPSYNWDRHLYNNKLTSLDAGLLRSLSLLQMLYVALAIGSVMRYLLIIVLFACACICACACTIILFTRKNIVCIERDLNFNKLDTLPPGLFASQASSLQTMWVGGYAIYIYMHYHIYDSYLACTIISLQTSPRKSTDLHPHWILFTFGVTSEYVRLGGARTWIIRHTYAYVFLQTWSWYSTNFDFNSNLKRLLVVQKFGKQ